jgi:hypothetical protein
MEYMLEEQKLMQKIKEYALKISMEAIAKHNHNY